MNKNTCIVLGIALVTVVIVATGAHFFNNKNSLDVGDTVVCAQDVQLCADGSYVSRSGPSCTFAPCPSVPSTPTTTPPVATTTPVETTQKITVSFNQRVELIDGVAITPFKIVEDSRCPIDVQCIQAGTVKISVRLEEGKKEVSSLMELAKPIQFANKQLELVIVRPIKKAKESIKDSDYVFDFLISPKK